MSKNRCALSGNVSQSRAYTILEYELPSSLVGYNVYCTDLNLGAIVSKITGEIEYIMMIAPRDLKYNFVARATPAVLEIVRKRAVAIHHDQ